MRLTQDDEMVHCAPNRGWEMLRTRVRMIYLIPPDYGCTCTCTGSPICAGVPPAMTTSRFGVVPSPCVIWRIGPTVLTIAAPAGLLMNPARASRRPVPFGSSESASTKDCFGGNPVTAACRICTMPWSNNVTCVTGVAYTHLRAHDT